MAIRSINPVKYALALMDALFSDEEMNGSCFFLSARGKNPQLPEEKLKQIKGTDNIM